MAAPADLPSREPPPPPDNGKLAGILKRFIGKDNTPASTIPHIQEPRTSLDSSPGSGLMRRVSRKVVPGLPRAKTFKRQQSEVREKLEAIEPTSAERRAVSVDRRVRTQRSTSRVNQHLPRASAPDFLDDTQSPLGPPAVVTQQVTLTPQSPLDEKQLLGLQEPDIPNIETEQHASLEPASSHTEAVSPVDVQSTTSSQFDAMINEELERKWILNLSMHFRDKTKREKFFVTYREDEYVWRRVTISLDYRNAPDDSLEKDLLEIKFQREKSAKIYEAIRDSLQDIQFYPTVTNLKLQTTEGRLHVHVVEDINEIINYPTVRMIQHLKCQRIKERDLIFDSHMSGFVYKVRVDEQTLIKKEIPGPDTVDEFLYEVNALNSLQFSRNVIEFYGVVVDDEDDSVKGLLINYAEKGALIDVIYDSQEDDNPLPWSLREKWARQIVQGLSDVHEAGFVQGDLTLSNIVIDYANNAKIIDINRRGCPVGWEPPEATPLIDSNQRISMYIGVKSDLYQLGMVLWALATLEDEPEAHRRPLRLDPEIDVPSWYRTIVGRCLHEDPRFRLQATELLRYFPLPAYDEYDRQDIPSISVEDEFSRREYMVDEYQRNGYPHIKAVQPRNAWPYAPFGNMHEASPAFSDDPYYYPSRGRSPPRSLPSNHDMYMGRHEMWSNDVGPPYVERSGLWAGNVGSQRNEGHELPPDNILDLSADDIDLEDEKAETPRRAQAAEEIVAKVQQELGQLEAGEAPTAGGENQTTMAASAPGASSMPGDARDEKTLPLSNDTTAVDTPINGLTTISGLGDEQPWGVLQPQTINEILKPAEAAQTEEPHGMGTAVASIPLQNETTVQPPINGNGGGDGDGESESFNHYTHDRKGDMPTRPTEAPPSGTADSPSGSQPTEPAELAGIGSKYGKQENYRMSFTDEDLGLPTPATTTNVTSQA